MVMIFLNTKNIINHEFLILIKYSFCSFNSSDYYCDKNNICHLVTNKKSILFILNSRFLLTIFALVLVFLLI